MELVGQKLGRGRIGQVYKIKDRNDLAVKLIQPKDISFIEIDILSRMKSPYLIRSIEDPIVLTDKGVGIVLDLKEKNLRNLPKKLSGGAIKRIMMSLIYGLECLHKKGFLHLDIKPSNCLFKEEDGVYTGYITDFNTALKCFSPYLGIKKRNRIGTLIYYCYENLESQNSYIYTDKSDVWSLGVTFLEILGFDLHIKLKKETSTTLDLKEKLTIVKSFWDQRNISLEIDRTVNENPNLTQLDKIDIIQLLNLMLQKDLEKRISSKDFIKTRFYKNNSLENTCFISNPKETLFIPYSSSKVIEGINAIKKYFKKEKNLKLKVNLYFLTLELFIRIMAMTPLNISNQTLESNVQKAFLTSGNYYRQFRMSKSQMESFTKNSYDVINYLRGDVGPNRYYYNSQYLEDLILINEVLLQSYNLIAFYNYLNIEDVLKYFRNNYIYKNKKEISDDITLEEFFLEKIPEKRTDRDIFQERGIFSYQDVKSETKLLKEQISYIDDYLEVQEKFRDKIVEFIKKKSKILTEKEKTKIQNIEKTKDVYNFYKNNFSKNIISEKVFGLIEEFTYGIIKEDIYDNLEEKGDLNSKYYIFIDDEDVVTLLVFDEVRENVTHYYSSYNENLDNYFKDKNITYKNNFSLRTSSICKINEICVLFIIYFNYLTNKEDYNMIYIEDKTIKVFMILISILP